MNSNNTQYPETRIQYQLALAKFSMAAEQFDFKENCNLGVIEKSPISTHGRLYSTEWINGQEQSIIVAPR